MTESTVVTPKKSGIGKIVLGIIVVLVVYFIYKSVGSATPKTPDQVVSRMIRTMGTARTAEFAGTLTANIEGSKNPLSSLMGGKKENEMKPVAFSLGFSGTAAFANWTKPQSSLKLTLTSPEFPNNGSAEAEFMMVGSDKYFKFNAIPLLGTFDFSELNNMWVHVDPKGLEKTVTEDAVTVTSTALSEEKMEKLKRIINSADILRVTEDVGQEDIAGIATYHYKVSVDEAEVMRTVREISQLVNGKAMSIDEEQKMTEFWTRTEIGNVQLWIGTTDYYLYRVSSDVTVAKTDKEPSSGKLSLDLQLRNFNNPITIEAPAGAKPMIEFMTKLFGVMTGGLKFPAELMRGK